MKITELMPDVTALIPYEYEKIKTPLYEQIIENILRKKETSSAPLFVQVSGIPGAGKSTFCKERQSDVSVFISFDAIMEMIPGYQQDLYRLGSAESFKKWEIPARVIGYEVLRRAVERKLNICLEHSGVNPAHVQLVKNLKKMGFATEIDFILCSKEKAYARAQEREKTTHRHTPKQLIDQRSALTDEYLNQYKKTADKVIVYNTSNNCFERQV